MAHQAAPPTPWRTRRPPERAARWRRRGLPPERRLDLGGRLPAQQLHRPRVSASLQWSSSSAPPPSTYLTQVSKFSLKNI